MTEILPSSWGGKSFQLRMSSLASPCERSISVILYQRIAPFRPLIGFNGSMHLLSVFLFTFYFIFIIYSEAGPLDPTKYKLLLTLNIYILC